MVPPAIRSWVETSLARVFLVGMEPSAKTTTLDATSMNVKMVPPAIQSWVETSLAHVFLVGKETFARLRSITAFQIHAPTTHLAPTLSTILLATANQDGQDGDVIKRLIAVLQVLVSMGQHAIPRLILSTAPAFLDSLEIAVRSRLMNASSRLATTEELAPPELTPSPVLVFLVILEQIANMI